MLSCSSFSSDRKIEPLFESFHTSVACPSDKTNIKTKLNIEQSWSDIDEGKPKFSDGNLYRCYFVHQKSHIHWRGIEPGSPRGEAWFMARGLWRLKLIDVAHKALVLTSKKTQFASIKGTKQWVQYRKIMDFVLRLIWNIQTNNVSKTDFVALSLVVGMVTTRV